MLITAVTELSLSIHGHKCETNSSVCVCVCVCEIREGTVALLVNLGLNGLHLPQKAFCISWAYGCVFLALSFTAVWAIILNIYWKNQNLIQEEIKRRWNSGNASYYSVQNLLSSRLLSKKIIIYETIILPVVQYGCETLSLILREEHRMRRELTTHLQLVPRSRKCGSIHPLPHTSSWRNA
jgi:hypothetical protein